MTESEQQVGEIERDERWLKQFSSPAPDAVTLERVKYLVRQACGGESAGPAEVAKSLAATKAMVRRELSGAGSSGNRNRPSISTTQGPSPAPTNTWLTPGGQCTKSQALRLRSSPLARRMHSPDSTRKSSCALSRW